MRPKVYYVLILTKLQVITIINCGYCCTATTAIGGFRYPILGTAVHMSVKLLLTRVWKHWSDEVIHPLHTSIRNRIVIPIGVVTALDIMFSNQAFLYVTVSEYTILKSSLVIFTYFWSIWYGLETFRVQLLLAICVICSGLSLAVYSQLQESIHGSRQDQRALVIGVIYCIAAAACGGLRWTLTQVLVKEDPQSSDVLVALYRFAPAAAVSILPFALAIDLPQLLQHDPVFNVASAPLLVFSAFGLLTCGGVIAFALIFVEVYLLQLTSSVSMGVLGQMKEILQISVSMVVFSNEHLSLGAVIGVVVSIFGAWFYRLARMAFAAHGGSLNGGGVRASPLPKMEVGEEGFFRRRGSGFADGGVHGGGFRTGEGDDEDEEGGGVAEMMLLQTYTQTPDSKKHQQQQQDGMSSGGATTSTTISSVRYTPLGQFEPNLGPEWDARGDVTDDEDDTIV